jgi:hypothetical protein
MHYSTTLRKLKQYSRCLNRIFTARVQSLCFQGLLLLFPAASIAASDAPQWALGLEAGAVWQNRNDVQIPSDTGTRFSLAEFAGPGPFPFYRLELAYDINSRHSLRLLYAPFEYTESGSFNNDVFFVDQTFDAGQPTEAGYRFNSYRATYRYLFYHGEAWRWRIGVTAKVRDAEITLKQDGKFSSDSNTGLVPLLHLYGVYELNDRWDFIVDFDGLASPQGRAIDLGLSARFDINRQWYVGGGYRMLEGGADNDEVYSFAWFNYLLFSTGYRF